MDGGEGLRKCNEKDTIIKKKCHSKSGLVLQSFLKLHKTGRIPVLGKSTHMVEKIYN